MRALRALEVSLSEVEENRCLVDGLEMLEPKLSAFGLPDVTLWWRRIEKIKLSATETTNDIISEVVKTRCGGGGGGASVCACGSFFFRSLCVCVSNPLTISSSHHVPLLTPSINPLSPSINPLCPPKLPPL